MVVLITVFFSLWFLFVFQDVVLLFSLSRPATCYIGCRLALTYRDLPAAASAVLRLKIWPYVLNLINSYTLVFPSYPWSISSKTLTRCQILYSLNLWLNGICFVTKHLLCNIVITFALWGLTENPARVSFSSLHFNGIRITLAVALSNLHMSFIFSFPKSCTFTSSSRGGTLWHLFGIFKLPTSLHLYFKAIK